MRLQLLVKEYGWSTSIPLGHRGSLKNVTDENGLIWEPIYNDSPFVQETLALYHHTNGTRVEAILFVKEQTINIPISDWIDEYLKEVLA